MKNVWASAYQFCFLPPFLYFTYEGDHYISRFPSVHCIMHIYQNFPAQILHRHPMAGGLFSVMFICVIVFHRYHKLHPSQITPHSNIRAVRREPNVGHTCTQYKHTHIRAYNCNHTLQCVFVCQALRLFAQQNVIFFRAK